MMRIMAAALAAWVAMAPLPAAAQSSELAWLIGKWCASGGDKGGATVTVCITFTARPDGTMVLDWVRGGEKGKGGERSQAIIRKKDGEIVLRSEDQDSDYRMSALGDREMVMESLSSAPDPDEDMKEVRYRVEGDLLIVDLTFMSGRTGTMAFRRTP